MTLGEMIMFAAKSIATELLGAIGWTIYLFTILWIIMAGIALVF